MVCIKPPCHTPLAKYALFGARGVVAVLSRENVQMAPLHFPCLKFSPPRVREAVAGFLGKKWNQKIVRKLSNYLIPKLNKLTG